MKKQFVKWTLYGLRNNFMLTATEVAEDLNLSSKQAVHRYERDASTMNSHMKQKFADYYGVPVESIVFDTKDALRGTIKN